MAVSGSGNRPTGRKRGSGNRRPSTARSGGATSTSARTEEASSDAAGRARERLQQQQAAKKKQAPRYAPAPSRGKRPQQQQRRPPRRQGRSTAATAAIFGTVLVVLIAGVIIAISLATSSGGKAGKGHDPYVKPFNDPAVTNALQHVPVSQLAAAGKGPTSGAYAISPAGKKGSGLSLVPLSGKPLTKAGKPLVVYLGAEYCPYCAATRWPLTIALSRFGTFKGLQLTASSPIDAYSSTHTLTYAKATYTSKYIAFDATEELSNACPAKDVVVNSQRSSSEPTWISPVYACNNGAYKPLERPSKMVQRLATKYDSAAYFTSNNAGGIPFINFGGRYVEDGSMYSPAVLHGATWPQIVRSFQAPTQGIGASILGTANRYTAAICQMTGGKPGSICNASYVKSAASALKP
jgi:hypothetical protein